MSPAQGVSQKFGCPANINADITMGTPIIGESPLLSVRVYQFTARIVVAPVSTMMHTSLVT
jgi:hypothetical protein